MTFSNASYRGHGTDTSSFVGATPTLISRGGSGSGVTYVKHIRTPSPTDVLSGRGGSVNQHPGNIQFRKWVNEMKHDYNLAPSKLEKAEICRAVITKVLNQHPPGKFLAREDTMTSINGFSQATTTGNWWIELDDERIMAKTSQALREGAPKIREEHQEEIIASQRKEQQKLKQFSTSTSTRKKTNSTAFTSVTRSRPVRSAASQSTTAATSSSRRSVNGTVATSVSPDVPVSETTTTTPASSSSTVTVALLPALPSVSVPPPFTSKLHHRSSRKGPIYNSTPHGTSTTNDMMLMNHPMATAAVSSSVPVPPKRVRVEYKGQHVNPSDASPVFAPSTTSSSSDGPSSISHLLSTSSTVPPMPITYAPLHRLEGENSSTSDNEGDQQESQTSGYGGCGPLQKGGLKRSHSLALSDIEGWSMEADFINPFQDEEEQMFTFGTQTSISSIDSNTYTIPPPIPSPRVGIFRETSTSSNGDFGGIGALFNPNTNTGFSNISNNKNNKNNITEVVSIKNENSADQSDIAETNDVSITAANEQSNTLGSIGSNQNNRSQIDDGWYERSTSISSVVSSNIQEKFDINSNNMEKISSWLMHCDDYDNASSITAHGFDDISGDDIFVPVSP